MIASRLGLAGKRPQRARALQNMRRQSTRGSDVTSEARRCRLHGSTVYSQRHSSDRKSSCDRQPIFQFADRTTCLRGSLMVRWSLPGAGLKDSTITGIEKLTGLRRLNLSSNALTNSAVEHLTVLTSLELLNLFGNTQISDRGIDWFVQMKSLRRVYLWKTAITADGWLQKLRRLRPDAETRRGRSIGR